MTSTFTMKLEVPADLVTLYKCEVTPEYDAELDTVLSLLTYLCKLLGRTEGVRFVISGFDSDDWGARVDREFCILLEQLPGVAGSLASGDSAFVIEFLEQGFWRTLSFTGDADELTVSCTSGDTWTPSSEQARLSRRTFAAMLASLVATFCRVAGAACPGLVAHPWFKEWRESLSSLATSAA
jgi:hypothetical protein